MAALYATKGYGQVEPNRLTGIVSADMESQAPAYTDLTGAGTPIKALENGMFLCVVVDTAHNSPMGRVAVLPGAAPETATPYLVFSERKQYRDTEGYSDFVDLAADKADGLLFPRLIGMKPDSDVFTTNTINAAAGTLTVGTVLYVGDDGYLTATAGKNINYQFTVTKVYTMPDGQPGVKLQASYLPASA